jgi:predicted HTH domain antitoxin
MTESFTLPPQIRDEVQILTRDLGLASPEATIQYLLQNAIEREKKFLVVRLYQNRQKTMRQCAELLGVDLEEMIDILRDFGVSFNDDLPQQLETAKKLAQEMRSAQSSHVQSR